MGALQCAPLTKTGQPPDLPTGANSLHHLSDATASETLAQRLREHVRGLVLACLSWPTSAPSGFPQPIQNLRGPLPGNPPTGSVNRSPTRAVMVQPTPVLDPHPAVSVRGVQESTEGRGEGSELPRLSAKGGERGATGRELPAAPSM